MAANTKALPSKPFSRRTKWNIDSWAWEILSCTFSIITTAIIGVVVFIYDEKPVPRLPFNLGLSSVISIIGTMSKSALLLTITSCISQYKWVNLTDVRSLQDLQFHDDASRGPWGSFMLLINKKGLYWVKLAALITIISMALDPAYQALIRIEQRSKYQNDPNATVKRALNFEKTNYFKSDKNAYFSVDWYGDIINAISKETFHGTDPSCPTGNCTFPIFSSLAFCSNCIDITKFLQQNSSCIQSEEWSMKRKRDEHENLSTDLRGKTINCTYWLPFFDSGKTYSSFEVDWHVRKDDHPVLNAYSAPSFINLFLPSADFSEPFQKSNGENISSHFVAMALIKFAPQTDSASFALVSSAHTCALSVCAKEYKMSMTSGSFRTEIVSTSYSEFGGPAFIDQKKAGNPSYRFTFSEDSKNNFMVDSYLRNIISFPVSPNGTISGVPSSVNPSSGDPSSGDPSSGDPSSSDPSSGDPSSGDSISVAPTFFDLNSGDSISGYAIADDPISRDPISDDPIVTVAVSFENKMLEVLQKTLEGALRLDYDLSAASHWFADPKNIYLIGLNTSTNIPKTMDRVAAVMSNRLRDISNITVEGQSGSMELYIRVSWWWLLFPISTVFFATICLISISITTRKRKMPIWKTSEFTLLFHGLDLSSLALGGDSVEMLKAGEMEDISSALRVRFGRDSERGGLPKLERMAE